jgi:hypothetical protein
MSASQRAELCLTALTQLSQEQCFELIKRAASAATPGPNYVGKGLKLHVLPGFPETGAVVQMTHRSGPVCQFAFQSEVTDGKTRLKVGGLATYTVTRHKFFGIIPVATEINGFGYYKRFLAEVGSTLQAADPAASVSIAVSARS